jgi:hypothetical protein
MADESRSVDDDFFDKGIISLCNTCNGTPDAPPTTERGIPTGEAAV